ncbi:MAG: Hsp33 family molecular chaperone HslO, partial [Bacilli bacterium]
ITALMGLMNKEDTSITITLDGNGPIGKVHTQYLNNGMVRGYVDNPHVDLDYFNKITNLNEILGHNGSLMITTKSYYDHLYTGTSPLLSGNISDDFAAYFTISQQIPTYILSSINVDESNLSISNQALIIQLMPNALVQVKEEIEKQLDFLNSSLKQHPSKDIKSLLQEVFNDFKVLKETVIKHHCLCSKQDMANKIMVLGETELSLIKEEDHQLEAVCPWCNTKYLFNEDDLEKLINQLEE